MTPAIRAGTIIRIVAPNFSWLMNPMFGMVQVERGALLTVLGSPINDGAFRKYPVLYNGIQLTLVEPTADFHITNGYIKVLKETT